VLRAQDDVYTSHIHADDLAAIALRAMEPDAPPGIFNACDDTELKMADWLDLVADHAGLPRPARVARDDASGRVAPALLSFMNESRRLDNRRMKHELGITLRYPTVRHGLIHAESVGAD
jgi:nucleoside-diphosphate-sugar epimerase